MRHQNYASFTILMLLFISKYCKENTFYIVIMEKLSIIKKESKYYLLSNRPTASEWAPDSILTAGINQWEWSHKKSNAYYSSQYL